MATKSPPFFLITFLWASVYEIHLSTDAMHKEDYRAMVRYAVERAGEQDVIVGSEPFYRFYVEQLGLKPRALFYRLSGDLLTFA